MEKIKVGDMFYVVDTEEYKVEYRKVTKVYGRYPGDPLYKMKSIKYLCLKDELYTTKRDALIALNILHDTEISDHKRKKEINLKMIMEGECLAK